MRREVPMIGSEVYGEAAPHSPEELAAAKQLRELAATLHEIKADLDAGVAAEGGAPLDRRGPRAPAIDESAMPKPATDNQGSASKIDFDLADQAFADTGSNLAQYGLEDEFEMLREGKGAAAFKGHEQELADLDSFVTGAEHALKQSPGGGDSAALAVLEQIRDKIDATEKQLATLNQNTANAASENRAANRSAGARAAVGSGRE